MWRRADRLLRGLPRPVLTASAAVAVLGIAALDAAAPREVPLAALQIAPVLAAAWYVGPRTGTFLACLAAGGWFVADELWPRAASAPGAFPWWSLPGKLAIFLVLAGLAWRLRRAVDRESAFARRDPLTGLANRLAFFEQAARELEGARRRDEPLSAAFLDVDGFSAVNERAGHADGDRILVKVARALSSELRAADLVARVGGDEFVALLPGADAGEARRALQRVRAALSRLADATGAPVTVSVGVTCFAAPPAHPDQLVRAADALKDRARAEGPGRLKVEPYGAVIAPRESQNQ